MGLGRVGEMASGCLGECVTACMLDVMQGPVRAVTQYSMTSWGDMSK